jgi:hypothetical protein
LIANSSTILSEHPEPATRLQFLEGALIGLTRLFCKQQRTSTSTNAERQTPNAERDAPGEGSNQRRGRNGLA